MGWTSSSRPRTAGAPDGRAAYVGGSSATALSVIDTAIDRVLQTIETGKEPQGLAATPDGRGVLVAVNGDDRAAVQVLDPATNASTRSIAVGKQPHWLDASADGAQLYVTNEGSNSVSVVDLAGAPTREIAVGNAPRKIAIQPVGAGKHAKKVSIANFAFMPGDLTIAAGESIEWTNDDGAPHGLLFKDGAAGEAVMLPGASFSRRFDKPGSYEYACSIHPYMTAKITVRANS
ncbi:MAG: plastocyanin/azurin family copper-binding protein [Burkholderiales bacterium]